MTRQLGGQIQIVGDDNFVTNTRIIQRGIDEGTANASLIKLNQIGTVSETIAAVRLCQKVGWGSVMSHRSGETEDAFLSDFAVAVGAGQMKSGATARSERLAKYNRLMEIEPSWVIGPSSSTPTVETWHDGRVGVSQHRPSLAGAGGRAVSPRSARCVPRPVLRGDFHGGLRQLCPARKAVALCGQSGR
jgi:enolase (EC 4.2.1.11)